MPTLPANTSLRERRQKAGYPTTRALAAALGVHPTVVERWERGTRRIPPKRAAQLTALLGPVAATPRSPFWTRCADRTCGVCIRCVRARQWTDGKYAHKAKQIRADFWPPEQDERLRQLAGTMDRREIAEVLTHEFPTYPRRTVHAVAVYAIRHKISLWPPGVSLSEVADLLGVSLQRVQSWVELGWLQTFPYVYRCGSHCSRVRTTEEALEAFILAYPEHYGVARGQSRLAQLARLHGVRRVAVRFSKPHPGRGRFRFEPTVFGQVCPACEQVTFSRSARPSACRTCGDRFDAIAA